MGTQLTFPDPPSVAQPSSEDASDLIKPYTTKLRGRVLRALRYVNATAEELEDATDMKHQTLGPRLLELRHAGLVAAVISGSNVVLRRPTRGGATAIVWRITTKGLAYLVLADNGESR